MNDKLTAIALTAWTVGYVGILAVTSVPILISQKIEKSVLKTFN